MARIIVELEKTAASNDVLSGTALDKPPKDGILRFQVASTVNTATLAYTDSMGWRPAGATELIRKRTDGIPDGLSDPWHELAVKAGSRPTIILAGTTGTCHFTFIFEG